MPRVADIKEVDGNVWVRLDMEAHNEGAVTFWTPKEIEKFKHDCVRDFLLDLFDQWKDRQ